jgi:trehalose/maltose hydrolase-like predicted phosphorylase
MKESGIMSCSLVNNPWSLIEKDLNVKDNYINETLFAIGNGYIGMRGNFEEGYDGAKGTGLQGTYINGFYESEIIKYGEVAYGYAEKSQTMLNVTNSKIIKLIIENEEFSMFKGEILDYERSLCFKDGILKRSLIWRAPSGKEVKIEIHRLISFKYKNIAAIHYEVTPLNFSGKIKLVSELDGDVNNLTTENDPRVGSGFQGRVLSVEEKLSNKSFGAIVQKTYNTKLCVACAMEHEFYSEKKYSIENFQEELKVGVIYNVDAEMGKSIMLEKFIAYTTSLDCKEEEILIKVMKEARKAKSFGTENLNKIQKDFLSDFWYRTDIEIIGDEILQQGIRFNMFHLLQAVGRDGNTNIAAKGLTGEGYEGHYFWDTEVYMLPFFLYNNPSISRKLLEYRYNTLPKAKERARIMTHNKGALYPWRTINGEECSAYYPAGTAQYHINADIAFAVKRYMEATLDTEFLVSYGAEILFETARFWVDIGEFIEHKGNKFCINEVTGPDEYTALVNNNCYTNLMARENLKYAYEIVLYLKQKMSSVYKKLSKKLELKDDEIELWKKAADNMYIPYDEKLKIYPQDDSFLDKTPWDFENTPKENYPLLIHYHPLVIYRHQVCKQADLILAQFLLSEKFHLEQKKRDFDFYEKVTTHDSSLSTCIFSIAASEIGYYDKAYKYFIETATMDLTNSHGNTKDGIHAANMAGTWMCLVNGFAGMRAYEGILSFNPYLPKQWKEYSFKITYCGRLIEIRVNGDGTSYKLLEGERLSILHGGESRELG